VNSFGKAFVNEENVHKSNRGRTKTFTDKTTQKGGFSKLCVKIKKDVIPTYSIFQHVSKYNLLSFSAESYFDSRIAS
jgi:hypothetical protein